MKLNAYLIWGLLLFYGTCNAQQYYIETGYSATFFKEYVNQIGENTLGQNYSRPQAPMLESGFRFKFLHEKIKWNIGANYNQHKINTSFKLGKTQVPIFYNLSYISLKTGINFTFLQWHKVKLQIHAHYSFNVLTHGAYAYNNVFTDFKEKKDFDTTNVFFHRGGSIEYALTRHIATYLNYNIATSFKENNKDSNPGERYALQTNSLSIGLLFTLKEK